MQAVATAGSVEDLRTLLAELELSVHAEYISPHFRHVPPAVPGAWLPPAAAPLLEAVQDGSAAAVKAEPSEAAQRLAWLPPTAAAVSLRLAAFDAAVVYVPGMPPARDTLQVCLPCTSRCLSSCLALNTVIDHGPPHEESALYTGTCFLNDAPRRKMSLKLGKVTIV